MSSGMGLPWNLLMCKKRKGWVKTGLIKRGLTEGGKAPPLPRFFFPRSPPDVHVAIELIDLRVGQLALDLILKVSRVKLVARLTLWQHIGGRA